MIKYIHLKTGSHVEFVDITERVKDLVGEAGVQNGMCYLFVPHTTAAVTVNEHADPDVVQDIIARLDSIAPANVKYRHMEGNAPAHVKAALTGSSLSLMVEEGRLQLGTWQGIFFCEFDGPRQRSLMIKIIEE
jgi:secondary thiamine-phosphate synthase enzyme